MNHPSHPTFIGPDEVRTRFSRAMSAMYREEVPQYGALVDLVADINLHALNAEPALRAQLARAGELERLDVERHGAIRVGTAAELATLRRLFAVMGMEPVGYYDLSVAGVPVHSTAFRPVGDAALLANPFRVFTSLLRLELIADPALRQKAADILARRHIFTPRALELIAQCETAGGLTDADADAFVLEALETFRWHSTATVDAGTYRALQASHRLVADVVCFRGPHINHLTPRTLDIDAAQAAMPARGMDAKDVVEGPPRRNCPILLRQTSFKALQEAVRFTDDEGGQGAGAHAARFGEIEQRGVALTRKGRALYDELLTEVRDMGDALDYAQRLEQVFRAFPDAHDALRTQGLAFYRYRLTASGQAQAGSAADAEAGLEQLLAKGWVQADPITYEDFLPVSAAGIFQSNLGGEEQKQYQAHAAQQAFEAALGACVHDEIALYEAAQQRSIAQLRAELHGSAAGTALPAQASMPAFAAMFAQPAGSPIRELFPYLSQPGMISLAGGYPSPSLFDAEGLALAATQAMTGGTQALQYCATEGLPLLREALAAQTRARGMQASAEQLLVTTGSQQAFDLLVRVLINPGDTVLVEVPAYPATLQTLRLAQARILTVPMDEHGLQTDALAELLRQLPVAQRPKLLYTVPNFSNPRGTLLGAQRREALVQLASTYGFWVVEDDPYGELCFDAPDGSTPPMPTALRTLGEQLGAAVNPVVYLSSLSKTVAPALRVGWMLADAELLRRCTIAKQTVDLCTSPLAQMVAACYLQSGRYPASVQRARAEYQRRMQALVQGIALQLEGRVQCAPPAGGMFVWATFAQSIDPQALFDAAVSRQVLYVSGKAFYPENAQVHAMRLSFAAPDVPQIELAVQRLAEAVAQATR